MLSNAHAQVIIGVVVT